ncbi:GLPGLI family protein [Aquimarina sp. SS2-1]|uniref:GLPGLI family protein n=1 Tax=Aquimarina besae TaxID=3342247 RepID=UPI00366C3228
MKKRYLLVTFMCFSMTNAQEMSVFYKEERKADYHQLRSYVFAKTTKEEDLALIKDKARDHSKELAKYEYQSALRISNNKSIYYPLERQYNDTINSSVMYGNGGKQIFISRETAEKEYKIVYIDLKSNQKSSVEYAYGKEYLIEEELSKESWEITNETKTMFGYRCKKALLHKQEEVHFTGVYGEYLTKNKKPIVIWYTEEISSKFGPSGYWGLPGLIVKVVEDDAVISLDKVLFSLDGFEVKPPETGEKITREGLEDIPMLMFNKH